MSRQLVINDVSPSVQYLADGVQTAFIFPFAIFKAEDLQVWADAERILSGFTLSGVGESSGGAVQFAAPLAAGIRLTLRRRLALERQTDFQTDGIIRANTLNDELDYQVAAVQQVAEEASRAVRRSPTSANTADLTLPEPESGRALKWSADGLALVNSDSDLDQSLSQAMAMAASSSVSATASEASRQAAELAEANALASAAAAAQSEAQIADALVNAPRKDANLADLVDRKAATDNLRFRRAGTGATDRPLSDKVGELAVSVLDFGAVADNATDNVAAFQRACDAVSVAGGGTVLVPYAGTGQYLFKLQPGGLQPTVAVRSNTEIVLAEGVRLKSQAVFAGFNTALLCGAPGAQNIAIRGKGGFKAADGFPLTGTLSTASTTITGIASTAGLVLNMPLRGTGIPEGASIRWVGANSVKFHAAASQFVGTTTAGSTIVTGLSSVSGLAVGQELYDAGVIADGTTIAAIGAGQITLSTPALAAKTAEVITVLARPTASGATTLTVGYTGTPFIGMVGVDNFTLEGVSLLDVWGADIGFATRTMLAVTNSVFHDVRCGYETKTGGTGRYYGGEDFLHFLAPSSNILISNCHGVSGDDFIAFNVEDFHHPNWDSTISNVKVLNCHGIANWAQVLRLYINKNAVAGKIRDIQVVNLTGTAVAKGTNYGAVGIAIEDLTSRTENGIQGVSLANVALDCSATTSTLGSGMVISRADEVSVRNLKVISPHTRHVYAAKCNRVAIHDVMLNTPCRNGGNNEGMYFVECTDVRVTGGVIENQKTHGIHLENVTRGVVQGVTVIGGVGNGVALNGAKNVRVIGNCFAGISWYAVQEHTSAAGVAAAANIVALNDTTGNANGIFVNGANSISVNNIVKV